MYGGGNRDGKASQCTQWENTSVLPSCDPEEQIKETSKVKWTRRFQGGKKRHLRQLSTLSLSFSLFDSKWIDVGRRAQASPDNSSAGSLLSTASVTYTPKENSKGKYF